ncbi:MAG: endonuclease NucS domain-containing protein [Thermoguttaceae bacterium]|jgi:hypothetical protein
MPLIITPIDLREQELEDLLFQSPDLIEPEMKMVSRQHPTDSGPLDLLGFDRTSTLVVIELKVQPTESHLDQGMRYYDWCRQNIAWLHRSFPKIEPENPPRLILVAPSFTDTVKRIAKYVQIELQLLEYQAIRDARGEKGIVFREFEFGQPTDPPPPRTIEAKLEEFGDGAVRQVFTDALKDLTARTIEVRPLNNAWISLWYKGKRFAYLGVKKKFFVAQIRTLEETWTGRQRITTREQWDAFCTMFMQPYVAHLELEK